MKKLKGLDCILLIDDEEVSNYYNTVLIGHAGIDVHIEAVTDAMSAIEYLTGTGNYAEKKQVPKPGIIFLDINMPGMNGWEFLEEYDKVQQILTQKAVVTLLTSSNNPDDIAKAHEISILTNYLTKPLTVGKLNELIDKYFPEAV